MSKSRYGGPTLLELLWEDMDNTYAQLQDARDGSPAQLRLKGECAGLARALAIFSVPMDYNFIRKEARRRWVEGSSTTVVRTKNKREQRRSQ